MTPLNNAKSIASSQLVPDTWLEPELTNSNHAHLATGGGAMNAAYQPILRGLLFVSMAESLAWAFRQVSASRRSVEYRSG
jgi:hypothetical protein